jgi:hypothetical protein
VGYPANLGLAGAVVDGVVEGDVEKIENVHGNELKREKGN